MFDEYLTQDVVDNITMEVPGSEQRVLKLKFVKNLMNTLINC